ADLLPRLRRVLRGLHRPHLGPLRPSRGATTGLSRPPRPTARPAKEQQMTSTVTPSGQPARAGLDGPASDVLLRLGRHLRKGEVSEDLRTIHTTGGRDADAFYRDRWSHDKVVRSTHGVNCTGSCAWKVYVKDGSITWEAQQTDYRSVGPDRPEYGPRGCPRGAAFSWYTYSPTRGRYPYVRGRLLELYRAAKQAVGGDPVEAWA